MAHPQLSRVHLVDYKVRILDSQAATGATTRVLLDATDGQRTWTTIGVSANIIEASWQALSDSLVYGLLHAPVRTEMHRRVEETLDATIRVRLLDRSGAVRLDDVGTCGGLEVHGDLAKLLATD